MVALPHQCLASFVRFFAHLALVTCFVVLVPQSVTYGQNGVEQSDATGIPLPSTLPGTSWRAAGSIHTLSAEQYSVVPGSDVFIEYGLQQLTSRTYLKHRASLTVEVFEMRYPSGAYGIYTFNRGSLPKHRREFVVGSYLVSLYADNRGTEVSADAVSAVEQLFASKATADLPPLVSHLPGQNKIPNSEKYLQGSAALGRLHGFGDLRELVDFTGGVEVATAAYRNGDGAMRLLIIEYHTPQSATAGYEAIMNHFNGLSAPEKEQRLVKRTGNYIIEAVDIRDSSGAQAIVGKIKYTAKVYWEGRSFRSIPLQFRPPDPAALEEAAETATVLLRAFYGIGLLLVGSIILGVFTGWSVFYWRRQRRRRLGMDNFFSDAGGTIRLNLDDYVFQPTEQPIKLLGKGDL